MRAFKYIAIAALVMLPLTATAGSYEQRLKAAEAYERVTPVSDMFNNMLDEMARNPMAGLSGQDVQKIKKMHDTAGMRQLVITKVATHFTLEEIEALSRFYGTAEGQAILKKFPVYMADVMPTIQASVLETLKKYMSEKAK